MILLRRLSLCCVFAIEFLDLGTRLSPCAYLVSSCSNRHINWFFKLSLDGDHCQAHQPQPPPLFNHLLVSVNWKFHVVSFCPSWLSGARCPPDWFTALHHHQYLHGHCFISFLLLLSLFSLIPHFQSHFFSLQLPPPYWDCTEKKKKRELRALQSYFPINENGITLYLFRFIHSFNEYFFSAYHVSNSSLKAVILADKSFFVSLIEF